MLRLAKLAIRRPVIALTVALVVAVALSLVGLGVADRVSPSLVVVPGTEASRAQHQSNAEFGPSVLVPILLEGPKASLDRQGPVLVRELAKRPDTRVMSGWDAGEVGAGLRRPGAVMIVAAVAHTEKVMVNDVQPQIDALVARTIQAPVRASITGQPTLDRGFREASVDSTRQGALLAVPIVFVVMLLLLRAPVAAFGLALLGGATALSGMGLMALVAKVMDVDAIAISLGTMTGLALGVGYGLLLYRRWRDEVEADVAHHDAIHAAVDAVATTGRGILVGGTAVIVALITATFVAPTDILSSLGIGAMLCAVVAVGGAVIVVPAALVILGHRVQWLAFPAPAFLVRWWDRLVGGGNWVVRHAIPVGAVATAVLAALALPLRNLETGPPTAALLPADSTARTSFERVAHVMGAGWPTPFNIVVVSDDKPITSAKTLVQLNQFQAQLIKDPRVVSVVGPGQLAAVAADLGVLPKKLAESTKLLKGGKKDLGRFVGGLQQAGAGASQLQSGLSDAASGAGQLQGGAGKLQSGAGQLQSGEGRLRAGLGSARSGAQQISDGLDQALVAARKLRDGAGKLLSGSQQIEGGLGQAVEPVQQGAPIVQQMAADVQSSSDAVKGALNSSSALSAQLDQAVAQLQALPASPERDAALGAVQSAQQAAAGTAQALGAADPKLAGASAVASAFSQQVNELSSGLGQLYAGSTALTAGVARLQDGNAQLAQGIDQLSGGGGKLTAGIARLQDGATQLEAGLGQLTGGAGQLQAGAGQLAGGLAGGVGPSGQLVSGLGQLQAGAVRFRSSLPSTEDIERLNRQSPGLFDSGYFVLAAVEGAQPAARNQATFVVNLEQGGSAGQITIIPKYGAASASTQELGEDLVSRTDAFVASTGLRAAVGGPAGQLGDFASEVHSRIWPVVIAVAVVVTLLLMALMRAILLPLVSVAFDLLTAGAAFGIATLLFSGDNPPLGGPGFLDPMTIIAAFAAMFGIGMVYEVQLLQAARDAFAEGEDSHVAVRRAMSRTAAASTGAAIAMIAAIVPFGAGDLEVVRQLGITIAIAIALDALIVRPVLLPAAAEVLGRVGWWPTGRRRAKAVTREQTPPRAPAAA